MKQYIIIGIIVIFIYLLYYYLYNYISVDDYSSLSKLPDLKYQLQEEICGQHLAIENIPYFLQMHYQLPLKALVLSLHGPRGTGKTHFVNIFKDNMYKNSRNSVYTFTLTEVPLQYSALYQEKLHKKINEAITRNPRSLFIFEGVEQMSPKIILSLKPFFEYTYFGRDANLNKPIFLFISNTGSELIIKKLYNDFYQAGNNRTSATLKDFDEHLTRWISEQQGGIFKSNLINKKIIDHYIPFLPLEKEHILFCVKKIFISKGIMNPKEEHMKEVLSYMEWKPQREKVYAVSGCKDIKHKVILIINKYKLLEEKRTHN